jgi:hypothetical protein
MSKRGFAKPPYSHTKRYPGDPTNKHRMTPFHMPSLYGRAFKMEKKARKN